MSATTKHEFHPDAESLNAFAEQALSERERSDVLVHLAVCGRCRQIVALARDAAGAEVAVPARRPESQPDAWWRRWRLVWVPTAVVTAFAAASISVYIYQADKNGAAINIAEQNNEQSEAGTASSSQPKQADAVPPSSPAPAPSKTKTPKPAPKTALPPPLPPSPQIGAAAAPALQPQATQQVEVAQDESAPASAPEQQRPADKGHVPQDNPSIYTAATPPEMARALHEEQKKQRERRSLAEGAESTPPAAAAAPPPSAPAADSNAPAAQNAAVPPTNHPLGMSSGSLSGFGSMKSSQGLAKIAAAEAAINLPSGLPAVSTAVAAHHMLAIDKAGALFLSEDAGKTWEQVLQQWTGHAVAVRRLAASDAFAHAAKRAEATPGAAGGALPSTVFFEIFNDEGLVWLSTDGKLWTAK